MSGAGSAAKNITDAAPAGGAILGGSIAGIPGAILGQYTANNLPSGQNDPSGDAAPANFTDEQIQGFSSTDMAKKYTPEQLALLKQAHSYAGGTKYSSIAAGNMADHAGADITPLVNDLQSWISAQASQDAQHADYATLSKMQPGRDQTILTGPQVSPNASLLGGR